MASIDFQSLGSDSPNTKLQSVKDAVCKMKSVISSLFKISTDVRNYAREDVRNDVTRIVPSETSNYFISSVPRECTKVDTFPPVENPVDIEFMIAEAIAKEPFSQPQLLLEDLRGSEYGNAIIQNEILFKDGEFMYGVTDCSREKLSKIGGADTIPAGYMYLRDHLFGNNIYSPANYFDFLKTVVSLSEISSIENSSGVQLFNKIIKNIDFAVDFYMSKRISENINFDDDSQKSIIISEKSGLEKRIQSYIAACYTCLESLTNGKETIQIPLFESFIKGGNNLFKVNISKSLADSSNQNVISNFTRLISDYKKIQQEQGILLGEIDTLNQAIGAKQTSFTEINQQLEELNRRAGEQQKIQTDIRIWFEENKVEMGLLLQSKSQKEGEIITLNEEIGEYDNQVSTLEAEIDKTSEQIKVARLELEQIKEEYNRLLQEIRNGNNDLTNENISNLNSITERSKQLLQKKGEIESSIQTLSNDEKVQKGKISELQQGRKESSDKLTASQSELKSLEQQIEEINVGSREQETLLRSAKSLLAGLEPQITNLNAEKQQYESRLKSMSDQLIKNTNLIKSNEGTMKNLKVQIETSYKTLGILGGEVMDCIKLYKKAFPTPVVEGEDKLKSNPKIGVKKPRGRLKRGSVTETPTNFPLAAA